MEDNMQMSMANREEPILLLLMVNSLSYFSYENKLPDKWENLMVFAFVHTTFSNFF